MPSFQDFCSNIYCSALWNKYNVESMRQLKVAYNRVFRILLRLEHRVSMSANFISRRLDPFPVVLRKSISSFRTRILYSGNILLRAIVDSDYFTFCSLSKHWKSNIFALHWILLALWYKMFCVLFDFDLESTVSF
mgnify:CR=1 FL=1